MAEDHISYYPLEDIHREFLKYAPAYAQDQARQAIDKVLALQRQGVVRDGVYYVVLVDLVGSTKFAAARGNAASSARIERFIKYSFDGFNEANIRNAGLFVKEIGDAVLFIFQHFPDVLRWLHHFMRAKAFEVHTVDGEMVIRTCVHVGEVSLQGVNPLSLAVSQAFKMEKLVPAGAVVLTETAYNVAWPTIARAYHGFAPAGQVDLDGYPAPVPLYRLSIHDDDDLARMVDERH